MKTIVMKRRLALFVAVIMALTLQAALPLQASAADGVAYIDADGNEQERSGVTEITESDTDLTLDSEDAETWYVVTGNVVIDNRITVTGNVHLIIEDGCELTANAGINVAEGNSLAIYAQSTGENMGKLTATGDAKQAGIGGSSGGDGGTITINGGEVNAQGENGGAGIGGGSGGGDGGTVTISGGTVTAVGIYGAGIGGGYEGDGGTVIITGGVVDAQGILGGAGIGGGYEGNGAAVTISGGTVITSTDGDDGSKGIGRGAYGDNDGTLDITNAIVFASSAAATPGEQGRKNAVLVIIDDETTFYDDEGETDTGTITLNGDYVIPDETLTIPAGITLNLASGSIVNYGAITNNGTIINDGAITNSGAINNSGAIVNNGAITGSSIYGAGTITENNVSYIDAGGGTEKVNNVTVITGPANTLGEGWYIVHGDFSVASLITVEGDVHLILADGSDFEARKGINVTGESNSLTVYAQSTGGDMGMLTTGGSESDSNQAGIGGGEHGAGGTVTINGGTVDAQGGDSGAGIGGGENGAGGTVTINGGAVNAQGGNGGAGIGSGANGADGTVIISGGTVTATGGGNGAGIGGGYNSNGGTVEISGGTVTATGGGSGGKGIGRGNEGMNDGTLNITNAIVFASSATEGVDIGRSNAILVTDSATTFYDTEGNNTVTLSGDYVIPESKTLTVPNNKTLNLASGTLTVNGTLADEGKGSITGGGTLTFGDFGSAAVSLATVTVNGTYTYTGSEITPDFIIAGTPLDEDEDYTVPEVSDNVDAGVNTANYTITGNGNYTGTKSGTFTIDKATPIITVPPTVNIYKGEFLPDPGTLDCEASTEGSFEWTNGNAAPEASDNYSVTFTPGDETNYDIATKTVYVMVLDRGELIALIEEAEDIESDAAVGDGHGQYPQAAHEAFAEAIKAASYVHGKAAASNTQDAINSAAETLQTAIETFNAAVISVDFDALGEKITEAKAIGRGNYTTATWNALQTAITDAEATRVTPHVTQTEIVGAFAALESAIDGLRTIYIPPPAEPDPDDTDPDDEADIPPYKTDDERAPAEQDGGGIIVPHIPDEAPRDALIVTDDGGVIPSYATTEEFPRDSAALDAQKTTFPSLALVAKDNTTVYLESKDADASFDFSAWIDSWADFFAYSDATYLGRYYIEADETGKPYFTGGDLTRLTFGNHELALFAIDGSKEAYGTWQNEPPAEPVKSGWLYENKAWYFYTDGAAKTGWLYWERNWYLLDSADGHMLVGWAYDKNYKSWFYLTGNGKMKIGWLYDNNYKAWFYLRGNGEMLTGTRSVGGKIYSFKGNGAWIG